MAPRVVKVKGWKEDTYTVYRIEMRQDPGEKYI